MEGCIDDGVTGVNGVPGVTEGVGLGVIGVVGKLRDD